jgi:hypothetical protein
VLPDADSSDPSEGELLVRSGGLFTSYWRRPDATLGAFDDEGYFRTGDKVREEEGGFRILGRLSVDIIKSGGYKLSALEIETELLKVRAGQIQSKQVPYLLSCKRPVLYTAQPQSWPRILPNMYSGALFRWVLQSSATSTSIGQALEYGTSRVFPLEKYSNSLSVSRNRSGCWAEFRLSFAFFRAVPKVDDRCPKCCSNTVNGHMSLSH